MTETHNSEIDVHQLMAEIREAVAQREHNGQKTLASASLELRQFLASIEPPGQEIFELSELELQPEFVPNERDHYHINELLQYHGHTFVWNAYRAILKREPDESGLAQFVANLSSGRYDKIDILRSLRFSPEGETRNVTIEGLTKFSFFRKVYRVPVIGYVVEMVAGVLRLPAMIHRRRQFEQHVLSQHEVMASHINKLGRSTFGTKSFHQEVADLAREQRKFAELQHQQVVGLFREQRQLASQFEQMQREMKSHSTVLHSGNGAMGQNGGRPSRPSKDLDSLLAAFADEFRGDREELIAGFQRYLTFLTDAGITNRVLDVGCGRGEWLEILRGANIEARGVENNAVLVGSLRRLELEVIEEDALAHLENLPPDSLNAVTAFHFVEHLKFEDLIRFFAAAANALRPGGVIILETPNPKNLVVGACNFYSDPTHQKPLFPESVGFMLSHLGFADVRIEYVNPGGDSPFTQPDRASKELDSWFYSPRDFAVIATKPQPAKI